MTITGCILAKNEEMMIQGCIESLKLITNSIILVDNGSTDNTVKIAQKNGCKVINSPNTIIDEGRNKYLQEATTEWVFVLDADERIDNETSDIIINSCNNAKEDIMGFSLNEIQYVGNGRFAISAVTRVFRVNPDIKYDSNIVHSSVWDSIKRLGGKIIDIPGNIHHFSYLNSEKNIIKRKKYCEWLENSISNGVVNGWLQYLTLGAEYTCFNDYAKANECFNKAEKLANTKLRSELITSCKALSALRSGDASQASFEANKLLSASPIYREKALFITAELELNKGNFNKAINLCSESIIQNPNSVTMLLNLISLVDNTKPNDVIKYAHKAISLNHYLLSPYIYFKKDNFNTFNYQECILSSYKSLCYHMIRSCHSINNIDEEFWKKQNDYIINKIKSNDINL